MTTRNKVVSLGVALLFSFQNIFVPKTTPDPSFIQNHAIISGGIIDNSDSSGINSSDNSASASATSNSNSNNSVISSSSTKNKRMSPNEFLKFEIKPKGFQKYAHSFPCFPKPNNNDKKHNNKNNNNSANNDKGGAAIGIYYIKVFKTASSTVSHIVKYFTNKHGQCEEHSNHAPAHTFSKLQHYQPNQPRSFLFTFIREPTKRAVSDFFYRKVTQNKEEINLSNFKNGCCRSKQKLNGQAGFQLAYISTEERLPEYIFWNSTYPDMVQNPHMLLDRVKNVFDSYDFIGVSERLNESLVALSFILNLSLSEIAYVSYRQSGSYLEIQKKCVKIVKPHLTMEVEEYLDTDEWKAVTAGDSLLHRTAMEALDRTIDNVIGRDLFKKRLSEYEVLLDLIKNCGKKCSLTCSDDGEYREPTSCRLCMNRARAKFEHGK
jgi:hypothetical protein